MSYVDAYLVPVAVSKLEAYQRFSRKVAEVYREYGATRIVECLLDNTVANTVTFHAEGARLDLEGENAPARDFKIAADAQADETVILSWTEWASKEARNEGLAKALADPRIQPRDGEEMLFEGRRLIAGGFSTLIEV